MTNLNVIRRTTAVNPVITTTKPEKPVVPDENHPKML
jgi:hypothetical protein